MIFNDEFLNEEIEEDDNSILNKSMISQYNILDDDNTEKSKPDKNITNIKPLKDSLKTLRFGEKSLDVYTQKS